MAAIFAPPSSIKLPTYDFSKGGDWERHDRTYTNKLKKLLRARNRKRYVGEIVSFGVADGTAQYMVASMEPLELVHLPLMDGYEFEYIDRLTTLDIVKRVESRKRIDRFLSKKV